MARVVEQQHVTESRPPPARPLWRKPGDPHRHDLRIAPATDGEMLGKLYEVFVAEEATLVEVNPLIVTSAGPADGAARAVRALDAKVTLDDNAMFRHPENAQLRDISAEDAQERMAKERGLTFVKLDGEWFTLGGTP